MLMLRALTWMQSRERGATAAEYALMISGIAVALVVATFALGERLSMRLGELATFVGNL